ncbi:unnamed protein product [Tuber melanosporum]|uniref:(Perigord truffle) hypothetical protein n=1 Tax=Tuber melanosporum (strain Mel28) TaxID=656061 RepID=D5GEM9_TUBMM|nr:uncharacterized protein GSTUM_00001288001 [Tuber melanosporum]CAZ82972.1 unnamed protein product [Tuber melanosporum]
MLLQGLQATNHKRKKKKESNKKHGPYYPKPKKPWKKENRK